MFGKANRKRRDEPRLPVPRFNWVRIASAVVVVAGVVSLFGGARWLLNRPIEQVVINGDFERVSADQLEAALRPWMGKGFLAANLARIQVRIAGIPWVAAARVSRRWPATLEISVTEEEPAAQWGADGLLNAQGRLFVQHTSHVPAELPRLSGPPGAEAEVAARYVAIQEQLVQRGLAVVALDLDRRGAWSFQLSTGIRVRLGSVAVDDRLALFYRAFDQVVADVADEVDYVDMRYTNGFSVGWKQQRAAGTTRGQESLPNA